MSAQPGSALPTDAKRRAGAAGRSPAEEGPLVDRPSHARGLLQVGVGLLPPAVPAVREAIVNRGLRSAHRGSDASIRFLEARFQHQVRESDLSLNPLERRALPRLRGVVLDYGCGLGDLAISAARKPHARGERRAA